MATGTVERPLPHGDGWRARVWWAAADGRRRSVYVYGPTERETTKLGRARMTKESQDVERERAGLLVRRAACPTLAEYVLEHHAGIWADAAPQHRAQQLARLGTWVEPRLGGRRLDDIARGDVSAMVAAVRSAGRSAGTANRVVAALSAVLGHAEADGLVASNVCRATHRAGRVTLREQQRDPETYSAEEVRQLVRAASHDERAGGQWAGFIAAAAFTGARPKSLRMLLVGDVRLEGETPHLVLRRTKSGRDLVVPVLPPLADALRPLVEGRRGGEYLFAGATRGGGRDPRKPVSESGYRLAWARAVDLAGVRPLTIYALRASFATLALEHGMSASIVRDLLGHSGLAVTNRYAGTARLQERAAAVGGLFERGANVVQLPPPPNEKP